ncbi:LysR family transcriptional regulator [Rahnella sp. Lac-M11]|uniref:LysR family transcriptional regulator n=1 Tax=Rahnella contaminans TaxID=2703882 RepID=A0A6M2B585_9GAMM|nr:LysR family transcriptional regulator [Rahnella contaminans]NGX87437.1 LysR family transcriptional regulator [Rahnella contaminans]
MDQIQAMKIFIRIAELESFSRAAEDLDLPRATVSTTLKRLEQRLGVRLFLRTTRQVKITDEGKIYYQRCLQLLSALEEADTLFAHHRNQPAGTVRIDMPHSLARVMVIPALQAFYEHYPHITLSVSANDNSVNLLDQGVDCVIRAWPSEDENLQSRHLANLEQITCASPAYFAKFGTPQTRADLATHQAIGYFFAHQQPESHLEFVTDGTVEKIQLRRTLTVSGADAYVAAAKAGFGLVQVSRLAIAQELERGELVEVLSALTPPPMPLYIMYPPGRFLAPRIRVFLDWLITLFSQPDA